MKVYTTVKASLLAHYNKVMNENCEEPYTIESNRVGDCAEDVLLDTAWGEANPDAPTSGPDCPPDPPEYVFDAAFLVEEMRWNLIEKQGDMADGMIENGEWTPQKAAGLKRRNSRLVEQFRIAAAQSQPIMPWFVAEIER